MRTGAVHWLPFGQLVRSVSVRGHQLKQGSYRASGRFQIVDQGAEVVAGYTDEPIAIEHPLPVIAFGDHTRNVRLVEAPFVVGADGLKLLVSGDASIPTEYVFLLAQQAALHLPSLGYARHYSSLAETRVPVLTRATSREVAVDFFRRLSLAEACHKALLAAKRRLKRALMQRWFGRPPRGSLVPLGDLIQIRSGGTPARDDGRYWGGDMPWASAKDLKGTRLVDTEEHVTELAVAESASVAPAGSLLILVRGMGLLKDVPVAICQRRMAFNQDVKALIPHANVDAEYLLAALTAAKPVLMTRVTRSGHGTGKLDTDTLLATPIWLAPAEAQSRLGRAGRLLDDEVATLTTLLTAIHLQKRGIMQKLLSGEIELPESEVTPNTPAPEAESAP